VIYRVLLELLRYERVCCTGCCKGYCARRWCDLQGFAGGHCARRVCDVQSFVGVLL